MSRRSQEDVRPRNGLVLMVLCVLRISGCQNQKEASLDDQLDNAKEMVADLWNGPVEYKVIRTKAKGERLDRPELEEIESCYESRVFDLAIYDDLSRLIRGGEAARLLGVGVDHGTRSICLEDGIDTVDTTWEVDALNACSENVGHNERTSKRIKQKCMNRFRKSGKPTGRPIAGYNVPEGVKSYDGWLKEEAWTEVVLEGARILRQTLDCSIVADYFNTTGFPLGRYTRSKEWTGHMVRRFYGNPLLKGKPQRGTRHTVKHHGSGRRISVPNPKGPHYYDAPHLAYFTEEEFDSLNELLLAENECYRRARGTSVDPLCGRSRSHSCFPGMHAQCWYCGYHYVWGGNGQSEHLMCSNARAWHCWHAISFSGPRAVESIVQAITSQLWQIEGLDDQFAQMVAAASQDLSGNIEADWRKLRSDESQFAREEANVMAAVKAMGVHETLQQELVTLKLRKHQLLMRRHKLEHRRPNQLVLPESPAVLREMLQEEFAKLTSDSLSFGKLLRQLVPQMHVYAVRLCDGGHLRWCRFHGQASLLF